MAGGAWRKGCLIQRDPLAWRTLRQAMCFPKCSFIPKTHAVLRHPQGTTPNQAPPRLSALGHQGLCRGGCIDSNSPCLSITYISWGLTPLMALCSRTFFFLSLSPPSLIPLPHPLILTISSQLSLTGFDHAPGLRVREFGCAPGLHVTGADRASCLHLL